MMEVTSTNVGVEPIDIEVTASNAVDVSVVDGELDITVSKKEYKIVGDEVYIAKLYDDAPQWMKDLVQLVVNNTVEESNVQLLNDVIEQLNQFATSYVPLNTYTQQILDLSNADTSMHALIETINSNFNDGLNQANAQIINLENTKASKDEVIAQVLTTLSAELANPAGNLGATIANLQQAIADGDSANASSIQALSSALEREVDARATAINTINTYVGVNEAGASTGTGLSAYLVGSDGNVGSADSQVANGIAIVGGVPTSKWQYNSALVVNGTTYNSGFGLSNSAGTGIGSEFWIDATKLKFTNSATTGRTAPFTIDASGATPQITFNGKVSFSNVTGAPGGGSNLLYNSAPMVANETKGWSVGWYNTGIVPVLGAGSDPWRPSGGGSVYAVVPGAPTVGTVFDVAQTTKVPVIGGTWYEASAYISSHRCTSYVTIAWYDSNNTYITEVGGTQTAVASSGALSNWSRTTLLAQAPANAARAQFYVRSIVNSTDPYCFVAFAYLGKAVQGQAVFSDWSEGTSAGVSSGEVVNDINNGNTTTINGGRITTGSITANQIAAGTITADKLSAGSISADKINAGILYNIGGSASNYTMMINFNTGEIHIK